LIKNLFPVLKHRVIFLGLIINLCLIIATHGGKVAAAPPVTPCDNWPISTRTLPDICPEIILDQYYTDGIASFWGLAFDLQNNLYVTRPATREILRLSYDSNTGRFAKPEIYGSQVSMFYEWLWVFGLINRDMPLNTSIAWDDAGTLWYSSGANTIRSAKGDVIPLIGTNPNPAGITFYRGEAFPRYQSGLLTVTQGSWNGTIIDGHELLWIPFTSGKPGEIVKLIPANVGNRTTSDAALSHLSFHPDHPVSVAVDHNGWIYVALREGRIIRLRPRPR